MLSLFNKKKVNIHSVSIPDLGWAKSKNDDSVIEWINPEHTIVISIHFFDASPDIPTIKNMEQLRTFFRNRVSSSHGGLIEVELSGSNLHPLVRTIFKFSQTPKGVLYLASITLPFKTCNFILNVQAAEYNTIGMRETLIAKKLVSNGTLVTDQNGYVGWTCDPYDNNFKNGLLMNKSENKIYDNEFPNHALTQVRDLITQLENGLEYGSELERLQPFEK